MGGGAWGLALAGLLSENGHKIRVWEYNPEYVQLLMKQRGNPYLLKDIVLPEEISFSNRFGEVLTSETDYVICAIPSQYLRSTLQQASQEFVALSRLKAVINVAKGIEEDTLMRMSEVLAAELPLKYRDKLVCLSGPSHAEEVARKIPTAVVIAGSDEQLLTDLQAKFSNAFFRVYRSHDLLGVEIGGAVKNVIAIAAGIIDGLGFGDNTKGALLTRGLVEIQRLGIALGAKPETFLGLSGIGDLITTAASQHSRNRFVGNEIGRGRKLKDILAEMKAVAEGVASTRSVYELSLKCGVEMPITTQVYDVLFEEKSPLQAITALMTRSLKQE